MKSYNEILKDIEKARKALKTAEEKESSILSEIRSQKNMLARIEAKHGSIDELKKISEKISNQKTTIKFLKNNARVALFSEITPIITEVLNNYTGKPYGEKTRNKISEEIKSRTGCRCHINARYYHSQQIDIYTVSNDYNITIGYAGGSELQFLIDNKIQAVEPEQLKLYYIKNTYFENIPQTIKDMKKAYQKAVEKQKELEKLCDAFNYFAVDGIECIYKDKNISSSFGG